jgi:hypothetical protein
MQEQHTAPIVLDDLREPRFTPGGQELLGLMEQVAELCPLDSATLHAQASAELGLDDFGPQDYRARLELLLDCYRSVPGLSAAGQVNLYAQFVQLLKNRLLLSDLLRREPEVLEVELLPPVVIAGLPRTGTTHLQQLLAATGLFRTLPYWESVEPFPLPGEWGTVPDPRIARTAASMDAMHTALPHLVLMHEMDGPEHVHEEIALLAGDFSTMFFETLTAVPAWVDHYRTHDQTPHYAYLRLQLQALQHLRGGRRWLLKSPQHLEQLPVLNAVFPGVVVVFTHRDPMPVVLSMLAMLTYSARMHCYPVPVQEIASSWIDRLELMLNALVRDRDLLPPERSVDVRFDDFMADEPGVAQRIYELAGEPLTDEARASMAAYLAGHQRGRLGRVATSAEMFGLDADDLHARFAPYVERFLA